MHFTNFVNAIRNGKKINAEIGDGQISTLLCHLAKNGLALKQHSRLRPGPKSRIIDNPAAAKLWAREYRPGWEPHI
ncbi:MAG: hypothetical protein CM1200mP29_00090 [Verrucomicrobiota bacterium]|nr:MAG: hypothetical protein CM1200mP29_00090 [Verrucomicrobiota bacterium]